MRANIYHVRNLRDFFVPKLEKTENVVSVILQHGGYSRVAEMELGDMAKVDSGLEATYRWSQHIDETWYEGSNVTLAPNVASGRSTSVGDIIVIEEQADEDGTYHYSVHVVDNFGFTELPESFLSVIAESCH